MIVFMNAAHGFAWPESNHVIRMRHVEAIEHGGVDRDDLSMLV
jgi:hypothetical protein